MSQEKVDRYKEQKSNRKDIMKKERRNKMLLNIGGGIIVLALGVWIGFSIHDRAANPANVAKTDVHLDAIQEYLTALDTEHETAEE